MTRYNIPARVEALLSCISPLTPRQLARALNYSPADIGPQLANMLRQRRVRRVGASSRQRSEATCPGSAYALGTR